MPVGEAVNMNTFVKHGVYWLFIAGFYQNLYKTGISL